MQRNHTGILQKTSKHQDIYSRAIFFVNIKRRTKPMSKINGQKQESMSMTELPKANVIKWHLGTGK